MDYATKHSGRGGDGVGKRGQARQAGVGTAAGRSQNPSSLRSGANEKSPPSASVCPQPPGACLRSHPDLRTHPPTLPESPQPCSRMQIRRLLSPVLFRPPSPSFPTDFTTRQTPPEYTLAAQYGNNPVPVTFVCTPGRPLTLVPPRPLAA